MKNDKSLSEEFSDEKGKRSHVIRTSADSSQRISRRGKRGNTESADWGVANPQKVLDAITAVSQLGAAIRFGYTKDGGAFAIGIVGDGEPYTEYVRPSEDIDLYLVSVAEDFMAG